ncbi:MAG TPA: laminin B domain-containing protein, partial [Verrucomicrobiota bacterium]|nr:laminin B domain-containing protein [Verrucomicrobiota bacterium]
AGLPDSGWRHYRALLHESAAWFDQVTRERATRDQLIAVLSNLEMLTIRAEFSHEAFEDCHIDNVVLLAPVQEGPTTPTVGVAMYAGLTVQGEVGARYRIDTTERLGGEWARVTEIVLPASSFFWLDPSSAAERRFYRAIKLD